LKLVANASASCFASCYAKPSVPTATAANANANAQILLNVLTFAKNAAKCSFQSLPS